MEIQLTRTVKIPDSIKIERYRRSPELGPKILFFSGGTALKELSKLLTEYTNNSIHLITPFDSGGSSAKIRDAFQMISVGDLRNRLMALADQKVKGNPDIYELFAYRLPEDEKSNLINMLYDMIRGTHQLVINIPEPMKSIICNHLRYFINKMPLDFDLSGANIGNLVLTGGYLNNSEDIHIVLFIFSRLVESYGIVKPIVDNFLHLAAELEDGSCLLGQHFITGRECPSIESPVKKLYLTGSIDNPRPCTVFINKDVQKMIQKAEIICYPMGSFYTSIIANLIPDGVGKAVAGNTCPKVYVPNTTRDPEQLGMDLLKTVMVLLEYLGKETDSHDIERYINFIIIDTENADYPFELRLNEIDKMGITVIDTELVSQESFPYIDPELLIYNLLSLT